MDNLTEMMVEDMFKAETERGFQNIIENREFVNFGREFQILLESKCISKKDLIHLLSTSPFEKSNEDSIRKKIDNWLENRNRLERNTAFQICILLKLSVEESKKFFYKSLGEKWVHYRNISDVIYDFCIRNHYSILTASSLMKEFVDTFSSDNAQIEQTVYIKLQYEQTVLCAEENEKIQKMRLFLYNNIDYFNQFRNTLYQYFVSKLLQPNQFCSDGLISKRKGDSCIDTGVLAETLIETETRYWNVDEIKAQKSLRVLLDSYVKGQKEVPRDIFIKCMLICGIDDVDTLNYILLDCGLNELYPRNKFDAWIYDSLIHSDEKLAYYRLIDTFEIYNKIQSK